MSDGTKTPMLAPTTAGSHNQFSGQYRLALKRAGIENSGKLNPTWVEWLMRFPFGWTDCVHSGNALVSQIPEMIGSAILSEECGHRKSPIVALATKAAQ